MSKITQKSFTDGGGSIYVDGTESYHLGKALGDPISKSMSSRGND